MTTSPAGFSSSNDFNPNHMTAVILRLLQRTQPAKPTQLYALLYDADRNHLSKFGRFITGDRYFAFSTGATPIRVHHAITSLLNNNSRPEEPLTRNLKTTLQITTNKQLEAAGQPDLEELSDSEIECLDAATPHNQDSAWKSASRNALISVFAIARTLPNWQEVTEHLLDPFPG